MNICSPKSPAPVKTANRTPRHIIRLIVEMVAPQPSDVLCDPACGTAGFLVAAGEYLREHHPEIFRNAQTSHHFHHDFFHGFDFDNTMLRIGSMNMLLHGVENPDIRYRDSLAQDHAGEEEKYTLVLANPPFAGSLDYENTAKDLLQIVKTKKTELLFLTLFLRLLKPGGRAAVIVPEGVLFGSSKAHKDLRKLLVEQQKLDAVISLPGGVFKPYAGVSTAILVFTKTNSGGTDFVWFYDVDADGMSLDDKRTPLLPEDKLGPTPRAGLDPGLRRGDESGQGEIRHSGDGRNPVLTLEEHAKNNLPDILARWRTMHPLIPPGEEREGVRGNGKRSMPLAAEDGSTYGGEYARKRTEQSFLVPKADIATQGYDLSINRYKEVVHGEVVHRPPSEILASLSKLESEIQQGMRELENLVR
jgi:type I restriction enzyme M protein